MFTACLPAFLQIYQDPRGSIDAMTGNEGGANQPDKSCILLRSIGNGVLKPIVVPSTRDAEYSTHSVDAELFLMRLDEPLGLPRLACPFVRGHGLCPQQ
jgi:hypothetical protein